MELVKILFPHVLGGSSVVEDEHLRSLCFGDYMHPEAEKKIYDEIPDVTLLTKAMDHYLKVLTLFLLSLPMIFFLPLMWPEYNYILFSCILGIQYGLNSSHASRNV